MSIEKAYNTWAPQYDTNINKTRDLDKKATIKTLQRFEFSHVIELGCGTGKNTAFLLEKAERVIGLDFSEEMLKKAKLKFNDSRVTFQKTDLTASWQIDGQIADLITCNLVLEHIKDLDTVFNQASKKLKKGGYLFISELHPFKQFAGSKAKFETEAGTQELETYIHHISEYLDTAINNKLQLLELKEWFDEDAEHEIPRLIGLVFQKLK